MKKYSLTLLFFVCVCSHAHAQTQQGFVRTIGRPGKPGIPLAGVTIRMRGRTNAVLSSHSGEFQISLPDKKDGDPIILQQVQKNGYVLKDKEMIGRQLVFSSKVPIEILLVDVKQLEADKKRIEDNAYKKADDNYLKKQKDLVRKLKNKEITTEKYRQELKSLQDKYEKYISLIGDMADRYARTDYDQLDSIDYEINICIERGDFDKADSLIHTVFNPETVLERNRAAKEEIRQRMTFAQRIINKAHDDLEAIRQDMEYAKRVIVLSQNLVDAYKAEGDYKKAVECLETSLPIKRILYGENSKEIEETMKEINQIRQ